METQTNDMPDRKPRDIISKFFKDNRDRISKYLAHLRKVIKENGLLKASKDKFITALEIDADHVKLAQLKKSSDGLKLIKLVVKKISPFTDREAAKAIGDLLKNDLKIHKGSLVVSLPRHSTIMRKILLPSTREEEIEEMIVFQALKYVPYSEDEITVDYQVINRREDGYSEVMLVIAHNDVVNRHMQLLQEVNLQPESVRLDSEAICDSYIYNPDSHKHPQDEAVALIDVGYSFTNIQIVCRKKLIHSRSVALGSSQLFAENRGKRCREELLNELARTFSAHNREKCNKKISRVLLSGAISSFPDLCKAIEKRFCVPVEMLDPLLGLELGDGVAEELGSKGKEFSFSTAIGLTLESDERRINLLPKALRERKRKADKRRELFRVGALFLCVIILASALFYKKIDNKEKYRDRLNEQLEFVDPLVKKIETMSHEMAIIQKELNTGNSVLDVLRELYQGIPPKVSLSLFSFEADEKVTLKGSSPTMTEVLDLIPKLESSQLFRNVTVQYLNKRRVKDKEFVDFLIQLQLGVEK